MIFTISKRFEFSASHVLDGLPEGHQCGRLHGHNYIVEVVLKSDHLDARGFVRDYGELAPIKTFIDTTWDHRHLNDWFTDAVNPTAENIARVVYYQFATVLPELAAVRVSETPKTWAEFRP